MAGFHTQVKLNGFDFPDSQLTFNLKAGITTADIGKAVTQDTTADNTVKLAGDGDPIVGVLYTVENRVNEGALLGTVKLRFAEKLPVKAGLSGAAIVAVGSKICGAGSGEVKAIDISGTPTAAVIAMYANAPRVWDIAADGKAVALSV